MAGLAGALGLGTYALSTSAAFGLTKRMDPALTNLERNRYIAGGLFTAAGLALAAFVSPMLGGGVVAGGLAALAGTQLSFAIDPVFQLGAAPAAAGAPAQKSLNGIFNAAGRQQLGAVVNSQGRQRMGAVFNGGSQVLMGGIGDDQDRYFAG